MDTLITQGDLLELEHAETKIERSMQVAFRDVGFELKHILDRRLYVIRYPTFEEYLDKKWEMSYQRAYQLMDASTIVENLSTKVEIVELLPTRETHVRPLALLKSPEQQIEVWQRVCASGNEITAKVVEAEVERYRAELARDWIAVEQWNQLPEIDKQYALIPKQTNHKFNETNDNIEWAAWSWNPVTGCLHDCPYCYARDIANRFYPQKFESSFYPGRLFAPANTKPTQPRWIDDIGYRNVFVCSMADLFGKWVPKEWIDAVIDQARNNPQWTFLFLTKFPIRMAEFSYPENVWLGTTVDRQYAVDRAEKAFVKIKASGFTGVCWLSCEPMLERLTFSKLDMFDWVVMGGASKSTQTPEYFPPVDDWVSLYLQARQFNCKVYQKTNLLGSRVMEYPTK